MSEHQIDEPTGVPTTGHEWDGIKELNTPLPRWWLWTFYATIVWALIYTIAYPAWPLLTTATTGILGYSSRDELKTELASAEASKAGLASALEAKSVEEILADEPLRQFAASAGAAAFKVNCVQCHGSGAAGTAGYPNLNDDDWLWGGDAVQLYQTIGHGIRFNADQETRVSEMPAFEEILDKEQIVEVGAFVASLSKAEVDDSLARAGGQVFAENCAACHGEDGTGSRELGAPDLTDAIWLYGSGEEAIAAQIKNPKHGVMPAWATRLGETTVKELAVYIHSLGGGE